MELTWTGDILVGADGTRSRVRELILGDKSPAPVYEGICVVNGFVSASEAQVPDSTVSYPSFLWTQAGMLMTVPIDRDAQTIAWGINMELPDRNRAGWQALQDSGEAIRLAKKDYEHLTIEPIRTILDRANESEARLWATYSIPKLATWHTDKVCLIGDAAHALPPNGQGSGLAFEDAAVLTRLICSTPASLVSATAETGHYHALFERFQQLREGRIEGCREKTKTVSGTKHRTPEWQWALKKWGFRAFFWWNSYELPFFKQTTYDVDALDLGK